MQKLSCPRGGAAQLTFSPDGDMLAGIGRAAVLCWTRSRGWEAAGIDHSGPLTGVAFHPAGRTLVYSGISNALWGAAPTAPPVRPATPTSVWRRQFAREKAPKRFTGVHFYPLTGIPDVLPNHAYVPQDENVAPRPDNWARGLAFTPDGRALVAARVATAGAFRWRTSVLHWQFAESAGVWQLLAPTAAVGDTEHGGALVGCCLVLAGGWGVAVCPVAPPTGLFVPDVRDAAAVAVAPRTELVAVCARGRVTVWNLRRPEPLAVNVFAPGAGALAFAPNGWTLTAGRSGGTVAFADAFTGTTAAERDFGVGPVTSLAYAPDGLTLAVAGDTGVVVVDAE